MTLTLGAQIDHINAALAPMGLSFRSIYRIYDWPGHEWGCTLRRASDQCIIWGYGTQPDLAIRAAVANRFFAAPDRRKLTSAPRRANVNTGGNPAPDLPLDLEI